MNTSNSTGQLYYDAGSKLRLRLPNGVEAIQDVSVDVEFA